MKLIDKVTDILNESDLERLLAPREDMHVSIYMPTHRMGPETQQDPVRLRNLLDKAAEQLHAIGLRTPAVDAFLAPARELADGAADRFWQYQADGLALFLTTDTFFAFRTRIAFSELLYVGRRFHITPLVPVTGDGGHFYILALSQNNMRLLEASRTGVSEVALTGTSTSLNEALRFDEFERQLQFRSASAPGAAGTGQSVFHGQGSSGDEASLRRYLQRFVHDVESGVRAALSDRSAPLVLAGVTELQGIYRAENRYAHLVEQGIEGNPDQLDAAELQRRAWPIVRERFRQAKEEALEQFQLLAGRGDARAAHSLETVLPAALYQRVASLIVPRGAHCWGTFDPETEKVEVQAEVQPGDEDLLDFAVYHTLRHRGEVYLVEPEEMPLDAPVAAIMRY